MLCRSQPERRDRPEAGLRAPESESPVQQQANPYASPRAAVIVDQAPVADRAAFIQRTYVHLLISLRSSVRWVARRESVAEFLTS